NANLMLTYAKILAEKHSLTINLRASVANTKNKRIGLRAVGFPAGSNGNPAFAFGYPPSSKPTTNYRLYRRNNILASMNYSFDQRYLLDATFRLDGSTAFGSNRHYSPFWSAGIGWNLHNEDFISSDLIDVLRFRINVGVTGNQNM